MNKEDKINQALKLLQEAQNEDKPEEPGGLSSLLAFVIFWGAIYYFFFVFPADDSKKEKAVSVKSVNISPQ